VGDFKSRAEYSHNQAQNKIIWEHGTKNFSLREQGKYLIVAPIMDQTEVAGVGIFVYRTPDRYKHHEWGPVNPAGLLVYEVIQQYGAFRAPIRCLP
jgi:hypothetical protein